MSTITETFYQRIKSLIQTWDESDIYAVSFFVYSNENFTYNGYSNLSSFAVSYNTERDCEGAGEYDEERWNYAFWRQDETLLIDPDDPDSLVSALFQWYEENGIRNIGFEDAENCYDAEYNYIGKGPVGHYELLSLVTDVAKRIQTEGVLKSRFSKTIPIIIHGLEYAWYDIEATKAANPNGEADLFFQALQLGDTM